MTTTKHSRVASLDFHPGFHHKHFGADFSELAPLRRVERDFDIQRKLRERYGDFGMGDPNPELKSLGVAIQPLDFLNIALGGRAVHQKAESVWTPDKPLGTVETLDDLRRVPDIDWESNPAMLDTWRQLDELKQAYPSLPVNNVQGVAELDDGGAFLVMHTPYTTAFRLMGEKIFEFMLLDEELAWATLEFFARQYRNLWRHICGRMGWHGVKIHFGDCAATMLSPDLYEKYSLPLYHDYMREFQECTIHSCGPSSHLLELFAQVPNATNVQLGDGTDLAKARRLLPGANITAYYLPAALLQSTPAEVERKLWDMAERLQDNFTICSSGVDPDTPEGNIRAYLETARKL